MKWTPIVNATIDINAPARFQPKVMPWPSASDDPPFAVSEDLETPEPEEVDFDTVRSACEVVSVTVEPEITVSNSTNETVFKVPSTDITVTAVA